MKTPLKGRLNAAHQELIFHPEPRERQKERDRPPAGSLPQRSALPPAENRRRGRGRLLAPGLNVFAVGNSMGENMKTWKVSETDL